MLLQNNNKGLDKDLHKKWIKSFSRRSKLSPDVKKVLNKYLIDENQIENISKIRKQIWVEVGFGSGENIFHQAQNHTDILLIGCELYLKGVTKLLINIEEHDVRNILIWIEDARWLINNFQDNSIERFFIFFPDPWPKRNHHKRRLINYDFLSLLAKKMTKDILIATDHQNYAEWIKTHLQGCHFLSYKEDDFSHFPTTKYHQKAIDQGHKIRFFRASKY
ncbi:MAG: tRNA (guanosine(46)-N7)-methyltransferase TrmB [Wolbachia endosymbiont of Fragariocoptes setiger]|nr:tRNA (guanosine(46)-N7)-methyltransferase TrmB [Wolbachia endosymbiont of Fragariocoptes setiger]